MIKYLTNSKYALALIFIATILLYFRSVLFDFSPLDEQWLIVENKNLLQNNCFLKSFTQPLGEIYYRPLLNISFIIDAKLGGLKPWLFHTTNLLLHLLCIFSLFKLLKLLCQNSLYVFLLTIIFAIHPSNLHAIAWIPGRNDLLLTFFLINAIYCLFKFNENKNRRFLFAHLLFFVLALFTKENSILFPLLFVPILFYLKVNRKNKLALVSLYVLFVVLFLMAKFAVVIALPAKTVTNFYYFSQILKGFLIYVGKFIFPINNTVFPTAENSTIFYGLIAFSFIIIALFYLKKDKLLLFFVFLVGSFLIVISALAKLALVSNCDFQEHRLYPAIALFLLTMSQIKISNTKYLRSLTYVLALFIVFFFVISEINLGFYKTKRSFITEAVKHNKNNYMLHFMNGKQEFQSKNYELAIENYNKAVQLNRNNLELFMCRGNAYLEVNNYDYAIKDFNYAIKTRLEQKFVITRFFANIRFGEVINAINDLRLITNSFGNTFAINVGNIEVNVAYDKKMKQLNAQIQSQPTNPELYLMRAELFIAKNNVELTFNDLKMARALAPTNKKIEKYYQSFIKAYKIGA